MRLDQIVIVVSKPQLHAEAGSVPEAILEEPRELHVRSRLPGVPEVLDAAHEPSGGIEEIEGNPPVDSFVAERPRLPPALRTCSPIGVATERLTLPRRSKRLVLRSRLWK